MNSGNVYSGIFRRELKRGEIFMGIEINFHGRLKKLCCPCGFVAFVLWKNFHAHENSKCSK